MDTVLNIPAVWLLPILIPLGTACALLWPRSRSAAERLAPWTALPALGLALAPPALRSVELPWLLLDARIGLDTTSQVILFFTALLWLASAYYAIGYLAKDSRRHRFLFFFLLAMSGNLGLILAQDMALFYLCFALMSFASYGLVVHNGTDEALRAGRVYLVLVIMGELLLFSGLVIAAAATGSLAWPGLGGRLADSPARELAMLLLFFGLGVKAGALPLHVWLPLAHPAAPVPASAVLSGAMIKAGLLGWLRLVPDTHGAALPAWGELCLVLGVSAAFFGVVVGLTQRNAKTVLAYSSISQMGLITVAVGLAFLGASAGRDALLPALAYAMHHGLAKGALFLGVGVAAAAHGSTRQRIACGIGLLIPALSLAGMPWTSGALAKALLKADAARAPDHWAVALDWLLPLAAVGTTLLMARFLWLTWPRTNSASAGQCTGMWIGWLLLVAASAGAVFLWPWGSEVSMEKLLLPPEKLLAALWPILVGAAVALLTVIARTRGYRFAVPEIPAGDLLAWIAPAGAGLRRVCSETAAQFPRGAGTWQAARVSNTRPSNTSNASSNKVEILLQQSSVYGALILALVGLLFVLFALT